MSDVANVSAGKPKAGGAVYRAPLGTALPTDAVSPLDSAFASLGYCSEDGLVNSNTMESDNVKAWGGDTVLSVMASREDTFSFTPIESSNIEVLKAVYGDANVSGSLATGITVKANNSEQAESSWVFDMVRKGNTLFRIVIPSAKITEIGEISYTDENAIGYPLTLTCTPDTNNNTHYEYTAGNSAES